MKISRRFKVPAMVVVGIVLAIATATVRLAGVQSSSTLGADLDSLADVISFGLAPAALGFAVGLRGALDVVILLYFVACGISRLARFNATAFKCETASPISPRRWSACP